MLEMATRRPAWPRKTVRRSAAWRPELRSRSTTTSGRKARSAAARAGRSRWSAAMASAPGIVRSAERCTTVTSWPAATTCGVRNRPMKPFPPRIRMRIVTGGSAAAPGLPDFFRQPRHDFEQITYDPVVGDLEDRRVLVLVDRDDRPRGAHPGEMLHRP